MLDVNVGSFLLWFVVGVSMITMAFWLFEQYLGWIRYDPPEIEHAPSDVQVRILTIGQQPEIVQKTVDALPEAVADVVVISEQEMEISRADVYVVPESFTCAAEKKGRALEWGRRNIACDKEYVLYLDEDTQAVDFKGLPDADIVQFGEKPFKTDSTLAYLIEVFRMGFQVEMRAFSLFNVPLYAWGGGIAIRQELEEEVTWNFESIVEDTSFVWRAAKEQEIDFKYCNSKFRNQAPPSIRTLISQRRRWFAGSISELGVLPPKYYIAAIVRNFSWAISAIVPMLLLLRLGPLGIVTVVLAKTYAAVATVLAVILLLWSLVGVIYMDENPAFALPIVLLAPILSTINAMGAFYGAISPPESFAVTEKSGSNTAQPADDAGTPATPTTATTQTTEAD